jgi:ParB family chromosome partitioning protein
MYGSKFINQFGRLQKTDSKARQTGYNDSGRIHMLDPAVIQPNPSQPRKRFDDEAIIRLADSIRQYGILQPLTVRRLDGIESMAESGEIKPLYEIIAGERRLRAAKLIGMCEIPCIIMEADDRLSAELALIENIQRENLNMFEQAGAIAALIDIYNLTQEQVARQLSSSQSYVANKLRILRLTAAERTVILENGLTERHARALLRIEDSELRLKALKHIASRGLNVASSESYIDMLLEEERAERIKGKRKIILKDIRIFYNTVDHAINIVRQAGIDIKADRKEVDDGVELTIKIKKLYGSDQKTESERNPA